MAAYTIAIISNPAAGQRNKRFLEKVIHRLKAKELDVRCYYTEKAGHAVTLATDLSQRNDVKLIVAAGGDGTLREVAEGMLGSDKPLGIIPTGTANVMARELGYFKKGRDKVSHIVDALLSDYTRPVYPFSVEQNGVQAIGLCWVGVGFDAAVLQYVNPKMKAVLGRISFVPAVLKAMIKEPREPSVLLERVNTKQIKCGWAIVSNITRYAGPFVLTERTQVNQQGMTCLLFPKAGAWARLVEQMLLLLKSLDGRADTQEISNETITLGDNKMPVQLDGDILGLGAVKITPLQQALKFKVG